MAEFVLNRQMTVPVPREKVFEFFSDAGNLEKITPPQLNFRITKQPPKLEEGSLIEYDLRLRGYLIHWRTLISKWDPPYEFIDEQLRGPYKQWIHRHLFVEVPNGETSIEDIVHYRLPFDPLGNLLHFLVRAELDRIFDFRQKAVQEILTRDRS